MGWGFLIGCAASLTLTPLAVRFAWAVGFLDHPEARKLHTSATALLGGAVVFVSAAIAWFALRPAMGPSVFIGAGALLALLVGVWDDRFGMRPSVKLLGQALAAAALLAGGLTPELGLPPIANMAITLVAIMGLMNAVNFLDNMNGIVGGLAALALTGFGLHSTWTGAHAYALAQFAIAGACVGFLPYNFPRARIFLGDAGSLFLGYSLAASALVAIQSTAPGWGLVGSFMILAYPAFDMSFVVVNRIREGRKVYEGGKDHSNHRLASVIRWKTTVLLTWLVGAGLGASGLVVLRLSQLLPALALSALWILLFSLGWRKLSSVPVQRPLPRSGPSPTPTISGSAT
jgi:UDP-GlcNAc:undecaprenyl-phosphate GlcNAc-1-phosphate transferase